VQLYGSEDRLLLPPATEHFAEDECVVTINFDTRAPRDRLGQPHDHPRGVHLLFQLTNDIELVVPNHPHPEFVSESNRRMLVSSDVHGYIVGAMEDPFKLDEGKQIANWEH
jgi:hypothetical protein